MLHRLRVTLAIFALTWLRAAAPLDAQQCRAPRTALVLSGGGAKGIAHIGMLRVLDSRQQDERIHPQRLELADEPLDAMLDLMCEQYSLQRQDALALASLVVDMRITQIVNGVRGVHAFVTDSGRRRGTSS